MHNPQEFIDLIKQKFCHLRDYIVVAYFLYTRVDENRLIFEKARPAFSNTVGESG